MSYTWIIEYVIYRLEWIITGGIIIEGKLWKN